MVHEEGEKYVLGLDQGTTSARAIVFNSKLEPVAAFQKSFTQYYPEPGWVEHEPEELVDTCIECIFGVSKELIVKGIPLEAVKGMGISNQRETTVVWDRRTGRAVHRAIVWSDIRTEGVVKRLSAKRDADKVKKVSGLHMSAYFAALKVRWLLDEVPSVREVYEQGELCFGTVDSWLIHRLTGGTAHVTDASNASRSMFMNIETLEYDDFLIDFFGVHKLVLPKIVSSAEVYGELQAGDDNPFPGLPIAGCLGDQSAALFGHLGFERGAAKNTYGTGCFLLYNTGNEAIMSQTGLLTTIAYQLPGQKPVYALEGSIAVAGSIISWFRNNLGLIETSDQIGELASQVSDAGGVYFVTAFSGLFAPYWAPDARGTIIGMTAYTNKCHLARAALEATCFQTRAILECMARDSNTPFSELIVDGGLTASNVAMQIQADILGLPVLRPAMKEPTALGGAIAAGLAVGVWEDLEDVRQSQALTSRTVFEPSLDPVTRDKQYLQWDRAVERARGWLTEMDEVEDDFEPSDSDSDNPNETYVH